MVFLCGGFISFIIEGSFFWQFDVRWMLVWIEVIFNFGSDCMNVIGRRVFKNLIVYNQEFVYFFEYCIL